VPIGAYPRAHGCTLLGMTGIDARPARVPAASRKSWGRIDALDLEPIVYKLVHADPGDAGLSLCQADGDVVLYRCFLKLCASYPGTSIVPTGAIDRVWHAHMLDTAKYCADCELVFGRFLDHFPYAGLRSQADKMVWLADFARTRTLFRQLFGAEIGAEPAASACHSHDDGADCCVGCTTSAGSGVRPRPERLTAEHDHGDS
jgi:hypothetical protein